MMTDRQTFLEASNPPGIDRVRDAKEPHADTRLATDHGGLFRHRTICYPPCTSASEKIWTVNHDWS